MKSVKRPTTEEVQLRHTLHDRSKLVLWAPEQRERSVESVDDRVGLHYIHKFLSKEECDHLIRLAKGHLSRSTVMDLNGQKSVHHDIRTSSTCFIPGSHDRVVRRVKKRAAKILGVNRELLEDLQVVKYEPGQFFDEHYDWFTPEQVSHGNEQRQYTIFAYLNDGEGNTEFPKLGRTFQPVRGNALKWTDCKDRNTQDYLTLHRGAPPVNRVKYGLNIWSTFDK